MDALQNKSTFELLDMALELCSSISGKIDQICQNADMNNPYQKQAA